MKCDFPDIDRSINEVIHSVGDDFRTKVGKEKNSMGKILFDPGSMNYAFKQEFSKKGFRELKRTVEANVFG